MCHICLRASSGRKYEETRECMPINRDEYIVFFFKLIHYPIPCLLSAFRYTDAYTHSLSFSLSFVSVWKSNFSFLSTLFVVPVSKCDVQRRELKFII